MATKKLQALLGKDKVRLEVLNFVDTPSVLSAITPNPIVTNFRRWKAMILTSVTWLCAICPPRLKSMKARTHTHIHAMRTYE